MNLPSHHRQRPARAFTLVEILIATAIMALLLACIHTAFFAALRLRQKTVDSIEGSLPVEEAMETMQRDIANVVTSTNGVFFGPLQSTVLSNMVPGQIGPDFYTTGGELDGVSPWGNIQKVDYLLTGSTNGYTGPGQTLVRAITHNLLPVNGQILPEEQQVLLNGVQSLTFLYYDGSTWQPTWDTTQVTNLPLAIKVQVLLAQPVSASGPANSPLELVVPLDVMLNTNQIIAVQ